MSYQQHPLSAAFPAMSEEDYQALKDSVESIGVQNPVTLFEGMVIDGWHRYSAAQELGMVCPTVDLGDVDPRDFVLAQNKARRHVTQAQLAMATTAVYAWVPVGANQHGGWAPGAHPQKTSAELAVIAGVGERTIKQAKSVQTQAAPEVVDAVMRGDLGLRKAAAIAKLPQEQQAEAIGKPMSTIKPKEAVTPEPEAPLLDSEPGDAYEVSEEELAEAQAHHAQTIALFERALESDEPIAVVLKENEQLRAENDALRSRLFGLMNEKNEAVRLAKALRRRLDAIERESA